MSETAQEQTPSDVIARRIVAFRKRLDLTRDQLAARCAELGYPELTSPALANIETGRRKDGRRRRDVTVDELMVLARALKVAPSVLLFPIGEQEQYEPLADWPLPTWEAFRWFAGEAYPGADVAEHWSLPVYLFRRHDHWVMELTLATIDDDDEAKTRPEHELRSLRAEMSRSGLTPPTLPADLAYLDERKHAYLTAAEAEAAIERGEVVRLVDSARPGSARPMKAGEPTRLAAAIERGRKFVADFEPPSGTDD
jgi:transcriptional regulator with XRE-family HTH domain